MEKRGGVVGEKRWVVLEKVCKGMEKRWWRSEILCTHTHT